MSIKQCVFLCTVLLLPAAAAASEATVKQAMQKKYPGVTVESVARTPIAGFYEVFVGGSVHYVDENVMLNGNPPRTAGTCDTPIKNIVAYGRQKGINGTPTLFFADGKRVTGGIPLPQLETLLDGAR